MDNPAAPIPSISPQPAVSSLPVEALSKAGPSESSNRRWLLWLFGGLAVLTLGITIGVFSAKFFNQFQSQPQLTSTPTSIQSPTPTPTTHLPANWKTYENQKYKYSIKYPKEVKLEEVNVEETDKAVIQGVSLTFFGPKYPGPGGFSDGFWIKINIIENLSSKSPIQLAQERCEKLEEQRKGEEVFGSKAIDCKTKVESTTKEDVAGARLTHYGQSLSSGNINFSEWYVKDRITYQINASVENKDSRQLFDQILSTFHFLK